jgi:surface protein
MSNKLTFVALSSFLLSSPGIIASASAAEKEKDEEQQQYLSSIRRRRRHVHGINNKSPTSIGAGDDIDWGIASLHYSKDVTTTTTITIGTTHDANKKLKNRLESSMLRNDVPLDVDVNVNVDANNFVECEPSIILSLIKSKKLDAGNLPLSSCSSLSSSSSSSKKKNNNNNNNRMICIDHHSIEKTTDNRIVKNKKKNGVCVDISDIPMVYLGDDVPDHHNHDLPHDDQHQQQQHQQLDDKRHRHDRRRVQQVSDCTCNGGRPDVSSNNFYGTASFKDLIYSCTVNNICPNNIGINCWNTAGITNMDQSFLYNQTEFNDPIDCWDTSQVTSMYGMFSYAYNFNQPINLWNIGQVTDMDKMFYEAYAFNEQINEWDVSQVTSMENMFNEAYTFNQPIDLWNTSQVSTMKFMFTYAAAFDQPISSWNVSKVTSMEGMFCKAAAFNNPVDSWNVSLVGSMASMFYKAEAFNQCLSSWGDKTPDNVSTLSMLAYTVCPNNADPDPEIGPWCQNINQGCVFVAPSSSPSTSPTASPTTSTMPSNSPTDIVVPLGICDDDLTFKFEKRDIFTGCKSFVGQNARKKCGKFDLSNNNASVALSCPSYCLRFCPPCTDGNGLIQLADGTEYSCKNILSKNKCGSQTLDNGDFNKAKFACPVSCGIPGCSAIEIEEVPE